MKIVQLDIQGFRSLKNVSWRPGDLNVVIGPNGSGKSNLLRTLELISAGAQGRLSRYIQDEGGIEAVIWDGSANRIMFSMETSPPSIIPPQSNVVYEVDIPSQHFGGHYYIEREQLFGVGEGEEYIDRGEEKATLSGRHGGSEVDRESLIRDELVLSVASSPFVALRTMSFRKRLIAWAVYQDIRTDKSAAVRQAPVSRLEQRVSPDGQNLINVLHTLYTTDRDFKRDINDAMFAAFGADFDELIFPPAADQRIQMRVRWKTLKREQSTADLSDGTLRFLFLMTVLASPNPPPLIAIDEPETGLHPSMLPIIAEFAVEAATRTQVIFTTHSDQFLSAFRDTRPTVTIARWENGETTLTTLNDSELEYWLKDYSLGKLFRSGELENLAS